MSKKPLTVPVENVLHRIKTDVLLVALGGFAPVICYPRNGYRPYSDDQICRLREFAIKFVSGNAGDGSVVSLAQALNIPIDSVHVAIWKFRHDKNSKYWDTIVTERETRQCRMMNSIP